MEESISIVFGRPRHGWLPVDFHYDDFHLEFDASDVLNDPIEELFASVTKLQDNGENQVTWWLEPGAYFFDFEKKEQLFSLKITQTDDLHNESDERAILLTVVGDNNKIIEPFRDALRKFSSKKYEVNDWPFSLDNNQIKNL